MTRDEVREIRPGGTVTVIDDGKMMYNVDGSIGRLKPGDEVTILGRAPEHDDEEWGLALWFQREGWPEKFILGSSMIRPSSAEGRP